MNSFKKVFILIATIGIFFSGWSQLTYAAIASPAIGYPAEKNTDQIYIIKQIILLKRDIRSAFKNGDKYLDQINTVINNIDDLDRLKRFNAKLSQHQAEEWNKVSFLIEYIKYKNRLKLYSLWVRWDDLNNPLTEEIINGISVPPEPGEQESTETIAWVDTNSNGVRDDVERFIAKEYGVNQEKYLTAMTQAKIMDNIYSLVSEDLVFEEYHLLLKCSSDEQLTIASWIEKKYSNTPERRERLNDIFGGRLIGGKTDQDNCEWIRWDDLNNPLTEEIINGISVPPEPGEQESTETIAWVDTNSNGVRDDVERKIAEEYGNDIETYSNAIEQAKITHDLLVSLTPDTAKEEYVESVRCSNRMELISFQFVDNEYLNTPDRRSKYAKLLTGVSGRVGGKDCYEIDKPVDIESDIFETINARNSKRKSDVNNLAAAINIKTIQWSKLSRFVTIDERYAGDNIFVGWNKLILGENYFVGPINHHALWIKKEDFMDPDGSEYIIGATTLKYGKFEIQYRSEESDGSRLPQIQGSYSPREKVILKEGEDYEIIHTNGIQLLDNQYKGLFFVWDVVNNNTITRISIDGLQIRFNSEVQKNMTLDADVKTLIHNP